MDNCSPIRLLFLGSTTTAALSSLHGLLVSLNLAARQATKQTGARLPRSLQITGGRLAEDVDFDEVGLEHALQRDDALDQQRVGVLEVQVHDAHHADAHELGTDQRTPLLLVIGLDGRGDALGFFGAAHLRWLNVLDDRHVLLLVDLQLDIEVYAKDDDVGEDVARTDEIENIGFIKRNLLRQLHHKPVRKESMWRNISDKRRRNIDY